MSNVTDASCVSPRLISGSDTKIGTESIATAVATLKRGGLLAYPTESVWGIGCNAYDEAAVRRILAIKQRPIDKGMIVVTDSSTRIAPLLTELTVSQRDRVIHSWSHPDSLTPTAQPAASGHCNPKSQAVTWLLPVPPSLSHSADLSAPIPKWITGRHQSVAVRVIAHPLISQLCQQMVSDQNPFGLIVSTSCNPSGQPPAKTLAEAFTYFGDQIGYLSGSTLGYSLPSQIRDAVSGEVIR